MSEESRSVKLPSFTSPPVNEVICGVQFRPLAALLSPHLGLLWSSFRNEFPTCKEVDPLIPVIELFGQAESGRLDLQVPFVPRVWFISKDENAIIQIQRDRFLHNWRKVRQTDEYPRYGKVKQAFGERLAVFEEFVAANELGSLDFLQFEMTYVNHIPIGSNWQSLDDVGEVFPDFLWRKGREFLPTPEKINWRTSFALPNQAGRLHLAIQSGLRQPENIPILLAELTVRGIGKERNTKAMEEWFDTAREWIVRGFADVTGGTVQQQVWKKQS